MRSAPLERSSANCFFDVASHQALLDDAARHLESYLGRYPDSPWLLLYLGHVYLIARPQRSAQLYRDAISASLDNPEAEVEARIALVRYLTGSGDLEEADKVLAPAVRTAEEGEDRILLAKVRVRQAYQYFYHGRHLDYAYHFLRLVERDAFPDGPEDLTTQWLDAMSRVCHALGRFDEALACKKRRLAMDQAAGDLPAEAAARFDIAAIYTTAELPSPATREEARKLFEAALATARAAEHRSVEARSHLELGRMLGGREGREHLEACLEIASARGAAGMGLVNRCRGALAVNLIAEDPQQANRLIDRATAASRDLNDRWAVTYGSVERMRVRWSTLPRPAAVADSLDVLEAIEALRELQDSGSGRAGLMAVQSDAYYWLSGRLLQETGSPGRDDLELAFAVLERLRARVLLEALDAASAASPPAAADPLVAAMADVLEKKVRLNRQLLDPELPPASRGQTLDELAGVESRESELRHQLAVASPSYGALHAPEVAALSEIERGLPEDEALLAFQLGLDEDFSGRFAGGAWLLLSTHGGTRVYRIPDRVHLEPALDVLLGMADLDAAAAGLARLYRDLLAPALADLPRGVERLVIVPDGKLHRLPFALLRSAPDAEPLIARYQLSYAPSATLWRRWRGLDPPASEVPALALADPVLAGQTEQAADAGGVRQWAFEEDARLAPLPFARQEGEAVVHALGGKSLLLVGADATERFLKEHDLRRYGVIHFATHAVIDDEVPQRSAVLLAPGAADEDGWLQAEDIVQLDLTGRAVVLASCSGAGGQVLRGEGPMSLARAFFQAQAPVVVASLWPLPDDASASLFKRFYRRLARGASVTEALAAAQSETRRRGVPARAWAGLVALGNGDLVPFPGGLPGTGFPPWGVAVLVLAALAALALFARRVRRG